MKIKRFKINENLSMSWTKEKFQKINNMKAEIENAEDELAPFLHDFLELNSELLDSNINKDEFYVQSFKYYPENPYNSFEIKYLDEDNDEYFAELNSKKFNELLEYLKDPETYKESKKFNI